MKRRTRKTSVTRPSALDAAAGLVRRCHAVLGKEEPLRAAARELLARDDADAVLAYCAALVVSCGVLAGYPGRDFDTFVSAVVGLYPKETK